METQIQETDLYKSFIKALDIHDMRTDDNPFVVKCCKIAEEYASQLISKDPANKLSLKSIHDDPGIAEASYNAINEMMNELPHLEQPEALTKEKLLLVVINHYRAFTKWVVMHTPEMMDSQRGRDFIKEIDLAESKVREFDINRQSE